jgi:hypothetical protein
MAQQPPQEMPLWTRPRPPWTSRDRPGLRNDWCVLTTSEAWRVIAERLPRGVWVPLKDVYDTVSRHAVLDDRDFAPEAKRRSSAPRWKRTIRNALQRHKAIGDIEWNGEGRFRLPLDSQKD